MKAILNVHAKTSWSSMGHRDQTVDVPVQSRNRSQGKVPHCWGQLSELKKAVFKISGSQLMKDKKSGVMTIKCNVKSLNMLEWRKKKTHQDNWGNRTLDRRLDNSIAAKSLQSCLTLQPHRRQPTRLPRSWDYPGKDTGVGCHYLLQCMKVKSESEVFQSCPVSDSSRPHGLQHTRLLCPWEFPGKSTGVGCHCLLRDNSIISRLNSLHVILLCRKCPCSQEICMNYLWFLKGSVKNK